MKLEWEVFPLIIIAVASKLHISSRFFSCAAGQASRGSFPLADTLNIHTWLLVPCKTVPKTPPEQVEQKFQKRRKKKQRWSVKKKKDRSWVCLTRTRFLFLPTSNLKGERDKSKERNEIKEVFFPG